MSGITQKQAVNGIPFPEIIPDLVPGGFNYNKQICMYNREKARMLTTSDIGKWVIRILPTVYGENSSFDHYPQSPTMNEVQRAAIKVVNVVESGVVYLNLFNREDTARNNAAWLTVEEFFTNIKPEDIHLCNRSAFSPT